MSRYRIAIDTGGTFTDLLALDVDDGSLVSVKVPSTPADPERAVIEACRRTEVAPADVQFLGHSSTVALNTLLERRGGTTGLLTTAGFRDVLEIARFNRPDMYDLAFTKPKPLVPRSRRLEVPERVGADGEILTPLDERACLSRVRDLVAMGVDSVAICFINAYRNPVHERRAAALVRENFRDVDVIASCELSREWREYERTSTTTLNAYLTRSCRRYLGELNRFREEAMLEAPFLVTRSDGGLMGVTRAARAPVQTLMSGPAAGVHAAARLGAAVGHERLITLDIGGTSCDIGVVVGGEPVVTYERAVEGFPVIGPMVDVSSIGAGGGTIAWVDDTGGLKLGPRSAGADPGPACYARGGREPTVTDAYVVLGLLDPESFLGGEMPLDGTLARDAVARLAERIGVDPEACALGIVRILEAQMVGALRVASIERGHDPREFALLAYGGAGGMHACSLARELGVPTVVVPNFPAHLSPWGILASEHRQSASATLGRLFSELGAEELRDRFRDLGDVARSKLEAEGLSPASIRVRGSLELRYLGQQHTLEIPCDLEPDSRALARVVTDFHRAFEKAYGYDRPGDALECVTIRIDATGALRSPKLIRARKRKPTRTERARRVWLDPRRPSRVPVYLRDELSPGERVRGPAIVEEPASVILVPRGQALEVDEYGMLHIGDGEARPRTRTKRK